MRKMIQTEITVEWERKKEKPSLSQRLSNLAKRSFGGGRKALFWKLSMRANALEAKVFRMKKMLKLQTEQEQLLKFMKELSPCGFPEGINPTDLKPRIRVKAHSNKI